MKNYKVRRNPADVKADLIIALKKYATASKADIHNIEAAYMTDKITDELAQHFGIPYDELNAIVASC